MDKETIETHLPRTVIPFHVLGYEGAEICKGRVRILIGGEFMCQLYTISDEQINIAVFDEPTGLHHNYYGPSFMVFRHPGIESRHAYYIHGKRINDADDLKLFTGTSADVIALKLKYA